MPPRGYKRNQYHDEFSDDSEEVTYKQSKKELKENDEQHQQIDVKALEEAIDILKKQRDESLLLVKTEHQMRMESANKLAQFEEERLQKFYENEVNELKRKMLEERNQSNKRVTAEGIYRKHRMLPPRSDDHSTKKDDVTLTIPLKEGDVIEDIRFMVSEYSKARQNTANVVVVLPGNRLIVNNYFFEPGMECTLKNATETITGQFISADQKELMFKPDREKRKKYSMELIRSGDLLLSYLPNVQQDLLPEDPATN